MSELDGFTSLLTRQIERSNAEMNATMNQIAEHNVLEDKALFETAEASVGKTNCCRNNSLKLNRRISYSNIITTR